MPKVPFSFAARTPDDLKYVSTSISSGQVSGDGPFTKKAQSLLQEQISDSGKVLLTTSCTHALEMAAILLDICPGDEVIVPSFTFVSSALAFHMRGARIIFADVKEDTLNIDETIVEGLITSRTRVIVAVHYGGVACEMDRLMAIAKKNNLTIVEDNAHGLYGQYKGQSLGSIGSIATQSFHGSKNISCGEGGALILNDPSLYSRAEVLREKGTNRSRFIRGQVDKYTWVDKGSSYVMSDILAGLLYSQLTYAEQIQNARRNVWEVYNKELNSWAKGLGASLPSVPNYCKQTYHLFYLLFPHNILRNKFIDFLAIHDIVATSHYQPLHSSDFVIKSEGASLDYCPVTTRVSECIVRLPLFSAMSDIQLDHVLQAVHKFKS